MITNNSNRPPVKKFNLGSVECTVWEKSTQDGKIFYQYSFSKKYKNAEGQWRNTSSFNKSDLAVLSSLAQRVLFSEIKALDVKTQQASAAPAEETADPDEVPF